MASNRKKSRRQIWLTKWDKVKAHDTLIDWCTRSEWPLNCMTVIFAWWRSNMPFQRLSGRLNYYITRWGQEVSELGTRRVRDEMWQRKPPPGKGGLRGPRLSWRSDELEPWCGRESHHPAEGALGTPDGVWGPDQLVIRCSRESQQSRPPSLRLSIRRTRKTQHWWP